MGTHMHPFTECWKRSVMWPDCEKPDSENLVLRSWKYKLGLAKFSVPTIISAERSERRVSLPIESCCTSCG